MSTEPGSRREVRVVTDDERALVFYDDRATARDTDQVTTEEDDGPPA